MIASPLGAPGKLPQNLARGEAASAALASVKQMNAENAGFRVDGEME